MKSDLTQMIPEYSAIATTLPPLEEPQLPSRTSAGATLDVDLISLRSRNHAVLTNITADQSRDAQTQVPTVNASGREVIDLTLTPDPTYSTQSSPSFTPRPSKKITLSYKKTSSSAKPKKIPAFSEYEYIRPRRQTRAMTKRRKLSDDKSEDVLEIERLISAFAES